MSQKFEIFLLFRKNGGKYAIMTPLMKEKCSAYLTSTNFSFIQMNTSQNIFTL